MHYIAMHKDGSLHLHTSVASYDADWNRVRLVSKSARTHAAHQRGLREQWNREHPDQTVELTAP